MILYICIYMMYIYRYISELIQKEKVHIDCEKGAQINILANKILT